VTILTLPSLDNMASSGRLKREPPDQKKFDGLVELGEERLKDSCMAALSLMSRFDLTYGAAHALAVAALRCMATGRRNATWCSKRFSTLSGSSPTCG
jgi:hypothetical protein